MNIEIIDPNNTLKPGERDLINKIPGIKEWELMRELKGGFSGAKVLLVWATYENKVQALEVFKFGENDKIRKEKDNWETFVRGCLDRTNVVPIDWFIEDTPLSLIVYGCASHRAEVETFEEHYRRIKNPEKTIDYIFSHLLNPWYSRCDFIKTEDLGSFITTFFNDSVNAIREELRKLSIDWTKLGIYITELCRTLPNPLHKDHINFPSYNAIVPFGIIHGDLKAQNILLIDRSIIIESYPDIEVIGPENSRRPRDVCLIDYANIKQANLFSDLTDLETSIKFQLLGMEIIKWEELINLEEHILNTLAPQATTNATSSIRLSSAELQKALSSLVAIRETAKKIREKDQRIEPLSFFVHLYVHTLKNIIHKDKTPAQKLYAYISAALILEKQLAKRRINGPDSY